MGNKAEELSRTVGFVECGPAPLLPPSCFPHKTNQEPSGSFPNRGLTTTWVKKSKKLVQQRQEERRRERGATTVGILQTVLSWGLGNLQVWKTAPTSPERQHVRCRITSLLDHSVWSWLWCTFSIVHREMRGGAIWQNLYLGYTPEVQWYCAFFPLALVFNNNVVFEEVSNFQPEFCLNYCGLTVQSGQQPRGHNLYRHPTDDVAGSSVRSAANLFCNMRKLSGNYNGATVGPSQLTTVL